MSKFLRLLLSVALLLTSTLLVNCSDDGVVTPNTEDENSGEEDQDGGLYSVKDSYVEIDNFGGEITITFLAMGDWHVSTESDWCDFDKSSGDMGDSSLSITVEPNADDNTDRTAQITIDINGYKYGLELCEVFQSSSVEDKYTSGNDSNVWISKHMTRNYLWNDEFIKIKSRLNYWNESDKFFSTALSSMSNIDEDGGYYYTGERYYYSTLTTYTYASSAPASRAMSTSNGLGVNMVYPVGVGSNYYILIASVIDESPADKAGIHRGMYVTAYNKSQITSTSLETCYNALMGYTEETSSVILTIAEYDENSGSYPTEIGEFTITPTTHTNNPIIYKDVYSYEDKNIGYLVYSEFDMGADSYLIDIFKSFKSSGVNELILDLRYNTGGDVYSSTVMATAITGAKDQGKVYCEMEYNDYRKAQGEVDYFYIGENPSMADYSPISDALLASLDLNRVYVITTGFTASASELIINGLRGLGVEVILIGQTTEGKNVGMEVITSADSAYSSYDFGQYYYEFAPITFYNLNAEGFKDFSEGFEPDFSHVETNYIFTAWGSSDYCVGSAINHICTGAWPNSSSAPQQKSPLPTTSRANLTPVAHGAKVYSATAIESK
ncbi:MAG: S41 family peptidase [Rikenellaceae bacterium]